MAQHDFSPVPLVKGPGKGKLFLAFIAFLATLGMATAAFIHYGMPTTTSITKVAPEQPKSATAKTKTWFYQEIGKGSPAEVATTISGSKESYTLEIKLASSRQEAEKIIDMLAKMDVQAYYTPLSRNGHVYYRIRRGLYDDPQSAARASEALRLSKNITNKVVRMQ